MSLRPITGWSASPTTLPETCLNDTFHQYTFDGASRISQVDSGATKYTYDPAGDRVRKDTGTNFTEYHHFGGNVLAEQDQGRPLDGLHLRRRQTHRQSRPLRHAAAHKRHNLQRLFRRL